MDWNYFRLKGKGFRLVVDYKPEADFALIDFFEGSKQDESSDNRPEDCDKDAIVELKNFLQECESITQKFRSHHATKDGSTEEAP